MKGLAHHLRPVDLARAAGMHDQSVRKYERWGFLPKAVRAPNGYRRYTEQHLAALLCARTLIQGYTWTEALQIMRLVHAGRTHEAFVRADAAHADLHAERQRAKAMLESLSVLAAEGPQVHEGASPGPPGRRRSLYVSEVAQAAGVAPSAIRFWESQGLLAPQRDKESRYRLYSTGDLQQVKVIAMLRRSGYGFPAIQEALTGLAAGRPDQARTAAEERLEQLAQMSARCAAATGALHTYCREYGGAPS